MIRLAALASLIPVVAAAAGPPARALHIAAYDAAPYAARDATGLFWGTSVDLWREVAEDRHWTYDLTLVGSMEDVIQGVATGKFDVAIGAITITPDRLSQVAFSYPSHRSGVAVAVARRPGLVAVLERYGGRGTSRHPDRNDARAALRDECADWLFERGGPKSLGRDTSISTVFEVLYWAVVTMTTVGYGDKAPHTHSGRAVAVVWMLGSLVLISLLSTSLVAQLTVEQFDDTQPVTLRDLAGMRLAAAESSSGAEFLSNSGLAFRPYPSLDVALEVLASHRADAVINSVGALVWAVTSGYRTAVEIRAWVLAPSLLGFAVPPGSTLLAPLNEALVRVTSSADWAKREASYFAK